MLNDVQLLSPTPNWSTFAWENPGSVQCCNSEAAAQHLTGTQLARQRGRNLYKAVQETPKGNVSNYTKFLFLVKLHNKCSPVLLLSCQWAIFFSPPRLGFYWADKRLKLFAWRWSHDLIGVQCLFVWSAGLWPGCPLVCVWVDVCVFVCLCVCEEGSPCCVWRKSIISWLIVPLSILLRNQRSL